MGGGLIVRLIDLVFILLFGFIVISQISATKEIEPPKSTEASVYEPDSLQIVVVGVKKNGTYPIDEGTVVLRDSLGLHLFLADKSRIAIREGRTLGVRIRANYDAPVQYSMTAAQICKQLGLPKGLDVIKLVRY